MPNYVKITDFAIKDSLPSGNVDKIVNGKEIDDEYNELQSISAQKLDVANPAFTGIMSGGLIDGGTY
jgi:hypothetical protein